MVTCLMSSKLIYLLIELGNIKLIGCNKAGQKCNQGHLNIYDGIFCKNSIVKFEDINLVKRSILHVWLGPGYTSAGRYNTVLKVQA